jgi:hypothetical protein
MAYVSPEGYHRHRCPYCLFVYEHTDASDVKHGSEHECPKCRKCGWGQGIYEGPDEPEAGVVVSIPDMILVPCPHCNGTGRIEKMAP